MIKIKTAIFILIFCTIQSYAQTFEAGISHTKVGLDDQFEVTFTFSGDEVNGIRKFTPPDFSSFMILGGPNQSTSMQFINGAASASKSYSYILKGKRTGMFTVGAAQIDYKGSKLTTEPIRIEIVKGSSAPKTEPEKTVSGAEIGENLFVRATVDKSHIYLGEQVTVTYKLYTRLTIAAQMSVSKLPQYQGFWAEELEASNNILFNTEVVSGKQYRVGILKRVALFPTQTGDLAVTAFELNVPVVIEKKKRSDNFFDDFFNDPFLRGETVDYLAKSNTVKVKVDPLPEKNKPDSFKGAVGDFSISSELDRRELKTNESLTLKVNVWGSGNIKLLPFPEVKLPQGFEKYEPKSTEQINRKGRISGRKTFDYLLVSRTPGKKEIPQIEFSYFDPDKKSYVTLNTESFTINVEQGERTFDPGLAGKEDIKVLGDDIRFIKTTGELEKRKDLAVFKVGFWAAVGVPFMALIGLIAVKRRDEKLAANIQLLKYHKAQKMAKNKLKKAQVFLSLNEDTAFYAEVSQALSGYLEDKLQIPKSEFSVERAVFELQKRNVNENTIYSMQEALKKCEYVRFAPKKEDTSAMKEMYDELTNLIIEIEKALSVKRHAL